MTFINSTALYPLANCTGLVDTFNVSCDPMGISPVMCAPDEAEALAFEMLRVGWSIGHSIGEKVRAEVIGSAFLNGDWHYDAVWRPNQLAFSKLAKRVKDFALCPATGAFLALQRGWGQLKNALSQERVPHNLKVELLPHSNRPIGFEDTPLVVSDKPSDLPNVITPKEFAEVKALYNSIASGSSFEIKGDEDFKAEVLKQIRIILSTQVGRTLLLALQDKGLFIEHGDRNYYSVLGSTVSLNFENNLCHDFSNDERDKVPLKSVGVATLFHELTHAWHHLVSKDIFKYNKRGNFADNPYTDFEEIRTIEKTNEFRREIRLIEKGAKGRSFHYSFECEPPPSFWSKFMKTDSSSPSIKKLTDLLKYGIRTHTQTTSHSSIAAYESYIMAKADTFLPAIASGGHFYILQNVLEEKASSIPSSIYIKALEGAATRGHLKCAKLLLTKILELGVPKQLLVSAFSDSLKAEKLEIFKLFMDAGIHKSIDQQSLYESFIQTYKEGHREIALELFKTLDRLRIGSQAAFDVLALSLSKGDQDFHQHLLGIIDISTIDPDVAAQRFIPAIRGQTQEITTQIFDLFEEQIVRAESVGEVLYRLSRKKYDRLIARMLDRCSLASATTRELETLLSYFNRKEDFQSVKKMLFMKGFEKLPITSLNVIFTSPWFAKHTPYLTDFIEGSLEQLREGKPLGIEVRAFVKIALGFLPPSSFRNDIISVYAEELTPHDLLESLVIFQDQGDTDSIETLIECGQLHRIPGASIVRRALDTHERDPELALNFLQQADLSTLSNYVELGLVLLQAANFGDERIVDHIIAGKKLTYLDSSQVHEILVSISKRGFTNAVSSILQQIRKQDILKPEHIEDGFIQAIEQNQKEVIQIYMGHIDLLSHQGLAKLLRKCKEKNLNELFDEIYKSTSYAFRMKYKMGVV